MSVVREQGVVKQLSTYRSAGFYMLRAPLLPVDIFKRITADGVSAEGDHSLARKRQNGYKILQSLSADPIVHHALLVASIDMLEGLERIQQGEATPKRVERVYSSILRYLVRMSTRTTPFGLFSGVAVGTFASETTVRIGTPALKGARSRPDMGWLLSFIQRIEENPDLVPCLAVRANHTAYLVGGRVIIPYADVYGKGDNRSIALRATEVVQYVLRRAQEPIFYQGLKQDILAAFPLATEEKVEGLLRQLWQHHFLISDLRPPLTRANPERYVLDRLLTVPQAAKITEELAEVVKDVAEISPLDAEVSLARLRKVIGHQSTLLSEETKQPIQVDSALRLEAPYLNSTIGVAAADVAETLLRMTRTPEGPTYMREYFTAFAERYGMNVEVPLLDLLSPEMGLGFPDTYTEPPRDFPLSARPASRKQGQDAVLCAILGEALYQKKTEVELTDTLVQALTQWTPENGNQPPAALEVYLHLQATSRAALDRDEWRGILTGLAYGGRTFCRFFDILGDEGVRMLQEYARQEDALSPDLLFAELSYLPTFGRGANVVIRPTLRSHEIVLNTTPSVPPEQVISLHDLVVGMKNDHFYLRSLSRQREVRVTQSHMLNITRAPNICRFLLDISQDGTPQPIVFDWGTASSAPFLPRVVRKKIVLSPAQWNLRPSMIEPAGDGDEGERFFAGVQHWREQWGVPRYLYMAEFDNRLLLDLEHPLLVAELQKELKKKSVDGVVTLQEMLPDFAHLWLQDQSHSQYMAELVIPLIVETAAKGDRPIPERGANRREEYPQQVITNLERSVLPGDDWTFLKLYVVPKQQDEIIAGPLRELIRDMQHQQLIDQWFFIRYADPEPHLRIRFHACNEQMRASVLLTALNWGRQLVRAGLARNITLDTYVREIERYGGPQAISALETVFTVNSRAVAEVTSAMYRGEITLDPLAVDVFLLDQFFTLWGLDLPARLAHIQQLTEKQEQKEQFRAQRQLFCELLAPWDPDYDPTVLRQRELLLHICSLQGPVLQQAACFIRELAANGDLWVLEGQLLASLAHMQNNRLLGISRAAEQRAYAFWRHALESIKLRPAKKESGKRC